MKNNNNPRMCISNLMIPIPYQVLNLLFLCSLETKFPRVVVCLFVYFSFYQQRTAFFFFLLLLKWYFNIVFKLLFLPTYQDGHNPPCQLLGRLLQFPFPFFSCIKYSNHLIRHFGQGCHLYALQLCLYPQPL